MNITDPNAVRISPSQMTVKHHCPANRKQTGLRKNQYVFTVCFDTLANNLQGFARSKTVLLLILSQRCACKTVLEFKEKFVEQFCNLIKYQLSFFCRFFFFALRYCAILKGSAL